MGTQVKSKSNGIGIRYIRSADQDRVLKVLKSFGTSNFTIRDLRSDALPDMTSGEIEKWSSSRIIVCVGQTPRKKDENSLKIWKLDGNVVSVLSPLLIE